MRHDLERLNRLLDDLAAERDVAERAALSAADVELAETAAFLAVGLVFNAGRAASLSAPYQSLAMNY